MFTAAAFLSAAALLFDDVSYLRLESSKKTVEAGESFLLRVYVGAHVPVNAVDVTIQYPQDEVKINSIDVGESVISIWAQDPYVDGDTVVLRGGTFRKGFLGEHLVATINAEAVETGVAEFATADITLLAGDGSGSEVTVSSLGEESTTLFVTSTDGTIDGDFTLQINTDIDGDGSVGLDDVNDFMAAWQNRNVIYDFNNDNRMNFTDFAIILSDSFFK